MGYYYEKNGTKSFTPDNNEKELYIQTDCIQITMADLIEQIREHFKTDDMTQFAIESEEIHTRCVGYDLYDGGDWDNYIIIRRI